MFEDINFRFLMNDLVKELYLYYQKCIFAEGWKWMGSL